MEMLLVILFVDTVLLCLQIRPKPVEQVMRPRKPYITEEGGQEEFMTSWRPSNSSPEGGHQPRQVPFGTMYI